MPSLQSFVANFSNVFTGNQSDLITGGNGAAVGGTAENNKSPTDQFSSLLNILGGGEAGEGEEKQYTASRKNTAKDPDAAAVSIADNFAGKKTALTGGKKSHDNANDKTVGRVKEQPVNSRADSKDSDKKIENNTDRSSELSGKQTKENKAADGSSGDNSKVKEAGNISDDKSVDSVDNDNNADGFIGEDKLREKIAAHIDDLRNILKVINELLALGGGAAVIKTSSITITEVNSDYAKNTGIQDVIGGGAENAEDTTFFGVFSGLQNTLENLQGFLKSVNSQGEQFTKEQTANLLAINASLKDSLGKLQNLLSSPPDFSNNDFGQLPDNLYSLQSNFPDGDNKESSLGILTASADDIKKLLADNISLIKNTIEKFSDNNFHYSQNATSSDASANLPANENLYDRSGSNIKNLQNDTADQKNFFIKSQELPVDYNLSQMPLQNQQNNNVATAMVNNQASIQMANGGGSDTNSGGNSGGQGGNNSGQFMSGISTSSANSRPLNSGGIAGTQFSTILNKAEHTPVAQQVVFHIKTIAASGSSKITIKLNPEELGKLDISLDVDAKGKTGITITADNKHTLELLQRDAQGLHKALSDAGLKSDSASLNFNLRGGEREGQGHNQSQASGQYRKSQPEESPEEINIAELTTSLRSYTAKLPDGLDIKI